ncbi:hypothetical protein N9579_05985 [Schleiferiaceae bacterium]|nr:hypothetical protein [Schleiferiaceae bacterium]
MWFRHNSILLLFLAIVLTQCSGGLVSPNSISPNRHSNIVVFQDTFYYQNILDLNASPTSSSSDSVYLLNPISDTVFASRKLINLVDSTYQNDSLHLIQKDTLFLDVEGVATTKSLSQISFISIYSTSSDFVKFANANLDTMDSYDGFIDQNPNNPNIFPAIPLYKIDSASICKSFKLNASVVNDMDIDITGTFSLVTNGKTILSQYTIVNSGDSISLNTTLYGDTLGKNVKIRFENVSCLGFSSPKYIQNQKTLKFYLDIDSISVFYGKVKPIDKRYFLGNDSISMPFKHSKDSLLGFVNSGEILAKYKLFGYDGPFYVIRELRDSLGYIYADSSIMVSSPSEFISNVPLQQDSILLGREFINATYYLRPISGFATRVRPHYRLLGRYGIQSKWDISYVQGRVRSSTVLTTSVSPGLLSNRSHLIDSMSLKSIQLTTTLNGPGYGSYLVKDSLQFTTSGGTVSYNDTSTWKLGNNSNDLFNFAQHSINRVVPPDSGEIIGAVLNTAAGHVTITIDTIIGLLLKENYSVEQGLATLIGYAEGVLTYTAASSLEINASGTLDSLILTADSVGVRFQLSGSSLVERSTEMEIRLADNQGNELFKEKTALMLNTDPWLSKTFILAPQYLMGEPINLLLVGDIRELEGSYLSVQDYFHLAVIIDLYD